jgi:hypothetical protein
MEKFRAGIVEQSVEARNRLGMAQYSDPARCSNFTGIEGIRE